MSSKVTLLPKKHWCCETFTALLHSSF